MLIAIIDDGIDKSKLINHRLKHDFIVDSTNDAIKPKEPQVYPPTPHGTTCASIIETYAPEAEFISISVFEDANLKTSCKRLATALLWCLENRIPLVHMSVGTELLQDSLTIRPIIARILMNGQIIVAARSNRGNYTLPACFDGVIGVVSDDKLTGFSFHACNSYNGMLLEASSRHFLKVPIEGVNETCLANSYAAPTITAAVHNILKMSGSTMSVLSVYSKLTDGKTTYQPTRPDFIEDACVLNLSGNKLLYNRFFFSYKEEYTSIQEFLDGCGKGISLVFVPSPNIEDNERVAEFIKSKQEQWRGMLFAGNTMGELRCIENILDRKHILTWSEDNCRILRWRHYQENMQDELVEYESPTVFIVEDGEKGIDLACELQELFYKEGYQSICVSNHRYSYLYGFEYIPQEIQLQMAVQYVNYIYKPDLVIFYVGQNSINNMIRQDENNYIVEFDEETKSRANRNQSIIKYCYGKKELEQVYQDIIGYFI